MSTPPLHERLAFETAFGQVRDADRRYLLMRADVFMGLFDRMPDELRAAALHALTESVFQFGSGSVRSYANPDDPHSEQLFASVAQGAASLGWGVWTFELSNRTCRLTVRNSPFAAATQTREPACAAITGMLRAVCEHAWKISCAVEEEDCCATSPSLGDTCHFKAYAR